MFRFTTKRPGSDPEVRYSGTSETIPGLAPDLRTLIASAAAGEPLPRCGEPLFDADESAGEARALSQAQYLSEVYNDEVRSLVESAAADSSAKLVAAVSDDAKGKECNDAPDKEGETAVK